MKGVSVSGFGSMFYGEQWCPVWFGKTMEGWQVCQLAFHSHKETGNASPATLWLSGTGGVR